MNLNLIEHNLLPYRLSEMANELIENLHKDETKRALMLKSRCQFTGSSYDDAADSIEDFLDKDKYNVEAIKLQGDVLYMKREYDDAEKTYLKAVR